VIDLHETEFLTYMRRSSIDLRETEFVDKWES